MNGDMDWVLAAFPSAGGAVAAQKALLGVCPAMVMPVLRQVSVACGIGLRLAPGDWEKARDTLQKADVAAEFYAVTGTGAALQTRKL